MTDYTILELAPVRQYATIGYSVPNAQTPAVFGSVADGSDATVTTLAAERQEGGQRYSEVLTLDFVLPDPSVVPEFYYLKMKARDNADFAAHPDRAVTFVFDYSPVADPPGATFNSWTAASGSADPTRQFGALAGGTATTVDWFPFSYVGSAPVDTANPSADTWFPINTETSFVAYFTYNALAGSGLRFTFYPRADSNLDPRTAYIDILEVRMVAAYPSLTPVEEVWFASPIRQRQRADGLGLSSASRTSQLRTKHGSLRGGPNGVD